MANRHETACGCRAAKIHPRCDRQAIRRYGPLDVLFTPLGASLVSLGMALWGATEALRNMGQKQPKGWARARTLGSLAFWMLSIIIFALSVIARAKLGHG
jgi:hypothetical protein